MKLLGHGQLPPSISWSLTSSAAAAISYADRGTSAIVASQLLDELHWSESQLGNVQASFFAGYALTQVLGGLLGGGSRSREDHCGENDDIRRGTSESYRTILPLSLFLTAIATLLFPMAAKLGGAEYASLDRFCLGLFEGLLLPAAMAGVSDTITTNATTVDNVDKATASSIVIAGCYLGSAWAYLSASVLFSEQSQTQLLHWRNFVDTTTSDVSVWSWVFYLNGIISFVCLFLFRDEFDFISPLSLTDDKEVSCDTDDNNDDVNLWKETQLVVKSTLLSKSGRAIILAQIGQGALLYSIASWGPLYLERIAASAALIDSTSIESNIFDEIAFAAPSSPSLPTSVSPAFSSSAVSASIAASSLILPQVTQALVGVGIGLTADKLSSKIGTRTTRRSLQIASGVIPAILLWYLSYRGSSAGGDSGNDNALTSPVFVFAAAQTISALSLGAVSVSHLDIAVPSSAGAVYALGNVAAAASGSLVVNLFGRLLDDENNVGDDDEFANPFRVIATLSALGSLIYGCTVESEIEIGLNETAV